MQPVDLVLLLSFAVAWPAHGALWGREALRAAVAAGTPGARRAEYRATIFFLWMFAALAAAVALERGHSAAELRLVPPTGLGLVISIVAIVATVILFLLQRRQVATPAGHAALRKAIAPLAWFLPHDAADRALFRPLSVTAGITEEWLFRGWLLAVLTPLVGIVGAIAVSSTLFGLAHAYQGVGGIVKTGLVGLVFAGLAWSTGSLWAPIAVHALVDWMQGDMIAQAMIGDAPEAVAAA